MILTLSNRFRQPTAACLALIFYVQLIFPLRSLAADNILFKGVNSHNLNKLYADNTRASVVQGSKLSPFFASAKRIKNPTEQTGKLNFSDNTKNNIGGPVSPEASSFKAAGADNLVNLFTGDFSYSIPLLDVGGYPVNLFYNGGITMEQEASWVGLGWNINPGSVSRNMRGVPDDFDGTDTLIQIQNVKPNKTWGGSAGVDGELLGLKTPKVNFNVGYSYNNYLGPEVEIGAGVSVSIPLTKSIVHEKSAPADSIQGLNLSLGANAKLSSRSGLTLSPSLNAGLHSVSNKMDLGIGLSTSYNSRTGIKDLNINSQMSMHNYTSKTEKGKTSFGKNSIHQGLTSSTISFARPSYIPTLRMPMQYANYSGQIEFGAGMFGLRGAATIQGYYSESKVADGSTTLYKPLVGFLYLENAKGRSNTVMDFNRLNDGEVTPNTKIISAPQYDYDVFNIQGEGTGGSIRAYRSELGFMRDNETRSKDKSISIGIDMAPPGHFGGNWNHVSSPTRSGGWDDANNTLNNTLVFSTAKSNSSFENVYFRNPGETTVTNDNMISKIGNDNLVRFKLGGSPVSPRLESQLEMFSKQTGNALGVKSLGNVNSNQQRDKRTQVTTMLTAADASKIGLDTMIKNYLPTLDAGNNLQYNSIARLGGFRKANHISEIDVLEQSGMRYVYGLPVYNTVQKDFTFSVTSLGDAVTNLAPYDSTNEPQITSKSIKGNTGIDGYVNVQQTPAYAASFLITGLLTPDYVDVTNNGITEDDLGNAVKFNYTLSPTLNRWRTPRNNTLPVTAHFNVGLKTEKRDNKATISYGEREAWYMHSIESKSMIAIFKTSARSDAKGVKSGMNGSINSAENANLKLDSIMLYTKADIKAKGFAGAVPLKTVHFEYNYSLCNGTPDNSAGGKLTLVDIYFTYNGQFKASKNLYVFNYGNPNTNFDNPNYAYNASDRWGTYKPMRDSANNDVNPNGLSNIDYPYTLANKAMDDQFAGAWALKKILLPSGGQIEVQYEADDYAYVQNRRASNMLNIYGLGSSPNSIQNNMLYTVYNNLDQNFVYIKLPTPLQSTDTAIARKEIFSKYLEGITQIAFKLNINMPKGTEPLTAYANYTDYGVCPNSTTNDMIYVKLTPVDGKSPLANASVQYLINNLPAQAFPGYDMSDETGITAFFGLIISSLSSLSQPFINAEMQVRSPGMGSTISLASSFVRLNAPGFYKYGGGHRVKRVLLKDNWEKMSGQYTSQYGQDYDYTTSTIVNGLPATISSGVASYEPGIGSEENPFREILQFKNKLPMASAIYGAIEMPVLEALYPSPLVGYSKVTVRSINRNGTRGDSVVRSSIGKQVTEFYTAKDYPTFASYTPMKNMDYHSSTPFSFLFKEAIDKRTTSQGFLVETNDMHGKLRTQSSYSERDGKTPISYSMYTYKNTGQHGLNDKVDFVQNDQGGKVIRGNMGVDMELMTDVREFSAITNGQSGQIQTDFFTFVPWPVFGLFALPLMSYSENNYRAVTTTKLINYHAIEDSVIVNDKGSTISTKTIAYDAETGTAIVTQTANEFNDPVYNVSYPAYWAYSGVAPAYKNIGMQFSGINFYEGKITAGVADMNVFESGDELYVTTQGSGSTGCIAASGNVFKLWAFDKNKNTTALTVPVKDLVFIDSIGRSFTKNGVSFKILRSGKRNNLGLTVSSATCMKSPIQNGKLIVNSNANVVTASAVEYKEKWQTDNDVIVKRKYYTEVCSTTEKDSIDCNGVLEKKINPYLKGLVGNLKPYRSYTFYANRNDSNVNTVTAIRKNGYMNSFSNYWDFNVSNNLVPDYTNSKWVWNSELTQVNGKGQELETADPLNRYTSAQYGFNKNMPVAVTQNARYGEAFGESFEDYTYTENINKIILNSCPKKNVQFENVLKSSIVNFSNTAILPHSGAAMLKIDSSSNAIINLSVGNTLTSKFNFLFKNDTARNLINLGGNVETSPQAPGSITIAPLSDLGNTIYVSAWPNIGDSYVYGMVASQFFEITTSGYYDIRLNFNGPTGTVAGGAGPCSINATYQVLDINNNYISSFQLNSQLNTQFCSGYLDRKYQLCPGSYKIVVSGNASHEDAPSSGGIYIDDIFTLTCKNSSSLARLPFYKDFSTINGCISTKAISGTDSMLNPIFSLVPNKRMQFCAWVREDCIIPCVKNDYTNSNIQIWSGGANIAAATIKRTGAIIEGWQKIEGEFTLPANATAAEIRFVNTNNKPMYVDDIRIHPFNANMKSYVYDPRTLRLSAELDENNYATFYDYDEEGQLLRVKKETIQGIKTINETRNAKQKTITTVQ